MFLMFDGVISLHDVRMRGVSKTVSNTRDCSSPTRASDWTRLSMQSSAAGASPVDFRAPLGLLILKYIRLA